MSYLHPSIPSSPNAIEILTSLACRYLMWRTVTRHGKPTKVPYVASTSPAVWSKASSTDPATWRTFDEAMACSDARPKAFEGVGVVLGDLGDGWHLCGIDLDSCLDGEAVADWAKPMLDLLCSTYVEVSPNGRGLKAFFFATANDASGARDLFAIDDGRWGCKRSVGANGADHGPAVEVYLGDGRFFSLTADRWPDAAVGLG